MIDSDVFLAPHIGTDEAGKGDYFGPLVVAAAYADEVALARLPEAGVRDAKTMSLSTVLRLDDAVKQICPAFDVVVISPPRYDELHRKMRNLNRMLAWGHARAIENVLEKTDCALAVADRFGDESYLEQSLMERGRKLRLIQRVRAESDPAVAAASVLARAAFLRALERLSAEVGVELPRGATHVIEAGREVVAKGGEELLRRVAKVHFKTTKQVLSRPIGFRR
jgi:ribonuclease HIII